MEKLDIENIIFKQIIERLDNQEQETLDFWLSQSEENRKEYKVYSELWKKSKELVLSDQINVESSLRKTKQQIGFKNPKRWIIYTRQIAAVLFLSIAFSFFYNYLKNTNLSQGAEQIVYQEIKATFGTQTKVILTDGSKVWLNSGSTLKFPISFENTQKRLVELNGEGYFEVSEDKNKPFIVNTSKLDVKVYGTSFNVAAYDDYNTMIVALVEGKVSLVNNNIEGEKELMILKPNDIAEFDANNKKLHHSVDSYMKKYTAWKDGQIIFFGDSIDVVIHRLEKWYNVDIDVADKELENYRITATFIDETLEQALNLLKMSSGIEYKIESAQKREDNSFSQRKVILSIKKS